MRKLVTRVAAGILLLLIALMPLGPVAGRPASLPPACKELAFSTEEDFVSGQTVISDGDLLGPDCIVCARNADLLLEMFKVPFDLGLDAADVIDVETYLVAFSTELDSSNAGQFTAGDLLVTNGVIILNTALTAQWTIGYDLGLDAVHFVGYLQEILAFLDHAASLQRPITPGDLAELFQIYPIDIWFSTEGTWSPVELPGFLDGDLLSARNGTIVAGNDILLPPSVPAGIPVRGVDFGLDAVTADRSGEPSQVHFSTEILFDGEPSFTDGDVLLQGSGVVTKNWDLVGCFEPRADFLGLDALHLELIGLGVEVRGKKFLDRNADGEAGANEPGLGEWEIHADSIEAMEGFVSEVTWTNSSGDYSFSLPPGSYKISEVCPPDDSWEQTRPRQENECGDGAYEVTLASGDPPHTGNDFGNYQPIIYLPIIYKNSP